MKSFENRKYIITLAIILIGVIFIFRLIHMQLIDDQWKKRAAQISENKITTYPARGIVFDRNHEKLIANIVYYDLLVVPKEVEKDIDSFALAELIGISIEEYSKEWQKQKTILTENPLNSKNKFLRMILTLLDRNSINIRVFLNKKEL